MASGSNRSGIIFVAPGPGAQGGITTVVENYQRTAFWSEFGCSTFSSTEDRNSLLSKLFHDSGRWLRFVWRLIASTRPRVVSLHTAHDGSFYRKFAYLVACFVLRIPVVLHVHPASFIDFYRNGGRFRRWTIRIAGLLADQIVVLSRTIGREVAEFLPEAKLTVLHNPVDISVFSSQPTIEKSHHPQILFLGWIIPQKGVYDLVDAMPAVLARHPDATFVFAGNKEVLRLETLLAARHLQNSAKVLGWIQGEAKLNLLHESWALVLPSYSEGVPNVLLEAMASGVPIVTTPVGGIPDILTHEKTALFVQPGDTKDLASAISRLVGDPELRDTLASAAFRRVQAGYSLQECDRRLRSIYERYFPSSDRMIRSSTDQWRSRSP